jgi:leucyl aminopeptidase
MIEVVGGPEIPDGDGDVLVVPVFKDLVWGPGAGAVVAAMGDWVEPYLAAQDFSGKTGQKAMLPAGDSLPFGRVLLVGVGSEIDAEGLRRAAGHAGSATTRYEQITTTLHQLEVDEPVELVTVGFMLGQYRFHNYQSDPTEVKTRSLVLAGARDIEQDVARGGAIAGSVAMARDLVNEPAAAKAPAVLASIAERIADNHGLEIRVYDEAEIEAEGFGGLRGVSLGADNPPRMVVMRHSPAVATRTVVFVGKGIVFDSGGLSIKSAAGMETMKTDMSGAAAVFAALRAIAQLALPVNVVGIAPLTENMTGGSAQRPGDVITARNGKTIEVLNTDAEGRLVLADGLSLAAEEEPDLIVDVATLTGASVVALGPKIASLFASDDDVAATVMAAAKRGGERLWQMPLEAEYRPFIDSDIADLRNTSTERFGGAITAALLLSEFVGETPWAHLDIAGPARASSAEHYITKGGTGFAVRTLIEIARAYTD